MRRTPGSRAALVAFCAVVSVGAGFVSAAELAEADAIHGGRARLVTRSTKLRAGNRSGTAGTSGAVDMAAAQFSFDGCGAAGGQSPSASLLGSTVTAAAVDDCVACPHGRTAPDARVKGLVDALQVLLNAGARGSELEVGRVLCSMADSMHEGLTVFDDRGTIVYVNRSLCQMLHRERADIVGSSAGAVFPGMLDRAGQNSEPSSFESEWRHESMGGALFKVSVHHIRDADGGPVGCFAVVRDFSRRSRAEIALRRSESELRLLSAQLLAAHETERRRIARGLHDGIGQSLGGIKFTLESCVARLANESPDVVSQNVRQLVSKVQAVIEDVSRVAMNLRPSVLDHLGIAPTIEWFSREFNAIYSQVELVADVDLCEDEVSTAVKTAIYRIIQETSNNAVKYAQARRITVTLKQICGQVELSIADDGVGFDPLQFVNIDPSGRGLGLASMRERVEATAGRFRLESKPGQGTRVRATWPSHCPRVNAPLRGAIAA